MKLISVLKWEANKVAVALVFASSAEDLTDHIGDLFLSRGSLAYLADGSVYVFDFEWTEVGA